MPIRVPSLYRFGARQLQGCVSRLGSMPGLDRLRRPQALVEGAGFGGYAGGTRTIVDEVSDAQDLLVGAAAVRSAIHSPSSKGRSASGWSMHWRRGSSRIDAKASFASSDIRSSRRQSSRQRIEHAAAPQLPADDLFKATAVRTRAFKASSSSASPSRKSTARLTLPSRLELKSPEGSASAAPLGKVILTTFL